MQALLTTWIQKLGSGQTIAMRLDCECILLHGSVGLNILQDRVSLFPQTRIARLGSLREVHQCLGQSDLSEHPIS